METRNHDVSFMDDELTKRSIRSIGSSEDVLLFVGAGASMDQGFPGWSALVARLLHKRLTDTYGLEDEDAKFTANYVLDQVFQIPAASIVDALYLNKHNGDHAKAIRARNHDLALELYKEEPQLPKNSTLCEKVLMAACYLRMSAKRVAIATTNYDDLLEVTAEAIPFIQNVLDQNGLEFRPYWDQPPTKVPDNVIPILHVHGYMPRKDIPPNPAIVFSEQDYINWDVTNAFRTELIRRFSTSSVLSIGSSLRDQNIATALSLGYSADHEKWALAPLRHDSSKSPRPSSENWARITELISLRTTELHLKVIQPDLYGQVYQFLHELASYAALGETYVEYGDRVDQWLGIWESEHSSQEQRLAFSMKSRKVASSLSRRLGGVDHAKMEVWIRTPRPQRQLRLWSSSQSLRLEGDGHRPLGVPIDAQDRHPAVRCFAERSAVTGQMKYLDDQRWTHFIAVPITVASDEVTQMPVGVAVLVLNAPKYVGTEVLPSLPRAIGAISQDMLDLVYGTL